MSDEKGELLDRLQIRHNDRLAHKEVAFPTAILVDKYASVRWVYEMQYGHMRMTPEDLFAAIERLALEEQNRELVRGRSVGRVLRQVFLMNKPEDLSVAMKVLQRELRSLELQVSFAALIMVDGSRQQFRAFVSSLAEASPSGEAELLSLDDHLVADYPEMQDWLSAWMHRRVSVLRGLANEPDNRLINLLRGYSGLSEEVTISRLVHVPFAAGTLSVALKEGEAFRDDDVRTLSEFADAISVAYSRFQDFETLARSNKELKETQLQLIQSEKMASLGQLVAGVAHELNTPIGAIHGNTQSATTALARISAMFTEGQLESPKAQEKLAQMVEALSDMNRVNRTAGDRVIHIVNNLRRFARLDESEWKRADLKQGLDETLMLLEHKTRDRIEILRDYQPVPPAACYPGQLNQVFMNLIVNAIQAIGGDDGSGKGAITIRLSELDDMAVIRITDTGGGMDAETQARIFDPGFTTKGVGVGTGLGLSIVYRIVETHRGRLEVESKIGEGTTFTLTVPIDGDPAD